MPARRLLPFALVAAAAVAASGCGAKAGSNPGSVDFKDPEQRAVSATVRDVSDAARTRDYEQICSDYLAAPLVKQLDAAKGTDRCPDQLERSLRDVDQTDLAVRDVKISGANAVARVQPTGTGEVEPQARFTLVREGPRWKLSGIG